jgi:TRAP-type C4-dicarboxylate transport system substrate-binding protein
MKKISRRSFLKVSGAVAAAGAMAACGGSGASTSTAAPAASTAAGGDDKFASLGNFTMTVGHAQPEGNPRFVSMEKFAEDVAAATNGMKTIDMTFQAMGATTTTIPYSDLYMGLKTSVADGQENPWVNAHVP